MHGLLSVAREDNLGRITLASVPTAASALTLTATLNDAQGKVLEEYLDVVDTDAGCPRGNAALVTSLACSILLLALFVAGL